MYPVPHVTAQIGQVHQHRVGEVLQRPVVVPDLGRTRLFVQHLANI